jgi:hypothetical protein
MPVPKEVVGWGVATIRDKMGYLESGRLLSLLQVHLYAAFSFNNLWFVHYDQSQR